MSSCGCSNNYIQVIKGDTFTPSMSVSDADGLVDLTDYTITSYLTTLSGNLITTLVVNKADQITNKGQFSIQAATDTWPLGSASWFIVYERDGIQKSVETKIQILSNA